MIKAILVVDADGKRIMARYYGAPEFPTGEAETTFEKKLYDKTMRTNAKNEGALARLESPLAPALSHRSEAQGCGRAPLAALACPPPTPSTTLCLRACSRGDHVRQHRDRVPEQRRRVVLRDAAAPEKCQGGSATARHTGLLGRRAARLARSTHTEQRPPSSRPLGKATAWPQAAPKAAPKSPIPPP